MLELRRKLKCRITTTTMPCRLRRLRPKGLLTVCEDNNAAQPTQLANRVSDADANHRSQEDSMTKQARQDQVTIMCCNKRACKKNENHAKTGGTAIACVFFVCVLYDQLYICLCAACTGLVFRWYESIAASAHVSEEYLVSHCTMERRQGGYSAHRARQRKQRGHNRCWGCNCPDCRFFVCYRERETRQHNCLLWT